MEKNGTLDDLYAAATDASATGLSDGVGHFNVYRLEELLGKTPTPLSFNRRLYYKITLLFGRSRIYYAHQVIPIEKQALIFTNPLIPYSWEILEEQQAGLFCLFTDSFFSQYGKLTKYPVFQPNGRHVYQLNDEEVANFRRIFDQMLEEVGSDFAYKYDVLKTLTHQLIQSALRLHPVEPLTQPVDNGARRVYDLFTDLLERQFPITHGQQVIALRRAAQYADLLHIHLNHLNRVVNQIAGQTTTELIAARLIKEAQILLRQTRWDIAQIAYCLGFEDPASFTRFFKKHLMVSPSQFRRHPLV